MRDHHGVRAGQKGGLGHVGASSAVAQRASRDWIIWRAHAEPSARSTASATNSPCGIAASCSANSVSSPRNAHARAAMCAHKSVVRPSGHGHSPTNGGSEWWTRSSPTPIPSLGRQPHSEYSSQSRHSMCWASSRPCASVFGVAPFWRSRRVKLGVSMCRSFGRRGHAGEAVVLNNVGGVLALAAPEVSSGRVA